jgi:hypothetical protein
MITERRSRRQLPTSPRKNQLFFETVEIGNRFQEQKIFNGSQGNRILLFSPPPFPSSLDSKSLTFLARYGTLMAVLRVCTRQQYETGAETSVAEE